MSSYGELDTLAGLDPGLDEGADGVDGEEHHDGKDEAEEEVEGGMGDFSTDGLDAHIGDSGQVLEAGDPVLVVTTNLAPFGSRVDDGVLKANMRLIQRDVWE